VPYRLGKKLLRLDFCDLDISVRISIEQKLYARTIVVIKSRRYCGGYYLRHLELDVVRQVGEDGLVLGRKLDANGGFSSFDSRGKYVIDLADERVELRDEFNETLRLGVIFFRFKCKIGGNKCKPAE